MSRSKQTRPPRIIAADRIRNPREAKGFGESRRVHRVHQVLKEIGVDGFEDIEPGLCWDVSKQTATPYADIPRVVVKRPRTGFFHPADKRQIQRVLVHFGELSWYGVQEISLLQNPKATVNKLSFGSLIIPGKIQLFEQRKPPWFLNGGLILEQQSLLESAGAIIEFSSDHLRCKIEWPDDSLSNFMLFEVLMHEIGHQIIQQFKGKRMAQVLRTKEHELLALAFARRCRQNYFDPDALSKSL